MKVNSLIILHDIHLGYFSNYSLTRLSHQAPTPCAIWVCILIYFLDVYVSFELDLVIYPAIEILRVLLYILLLLSQPIFLAQEMNTLSGKNTSNVIHEQVP